MRVCESMDLNAAHTFVVAVWQGCQVMGSLGTNTLLCPEQLTVLGLGGQLGPNTAALL